MKILALGLSRTGTDSLRSALQRLGYDNVYHGFAVVEQSVWTDGRAWYDLLDRKFGKNDLSINQQDFDNILWDYVAVSDIPAVLFADELLDAYPDAAVILNKRSDLQEWKNSFRNTTLAAEQSLVMRLLSYFNTELFWLQRTFELVIFNLFYGQFESLAESTYTSHYERIERKLRRMDRKFLEWEVHDGWSPLCEFLGKPMPETEFPRGNAKQAHDERIASLVGKRVNSAMQKAMALLVGLSVILVGVVWSLL